LGLAVANSLAGIQAGARQVEVCVNGLGERAGNAALEEVVMALKIRPDQFDGLETGVRTEELARTSRLVSRLTGYPIQYNKAVVGRNAFAHESGIHQHGVLAERTTYEIIDAASVGQTGRQIVLGKHSGRHAFRDTLQKMGITIQVDALGDVIIQLEADGVKVSGRGVSTDVVEASARAYLSAVNKVVRVRARDEERAKEIGP